VTSDFKLEVAIRPFRACSIHPIIIIGTVRSLWTWLLGRYYVPQNAFLVKNIFAKPELFELQNLLNSISNYFLNV